MDPDSLQRLSFGGGVSGSVFSPIVLLVILVAGILIWRLPRTKAIIPFFLAGMVVPFDQIVLIGPFHFPMLRVLLLFGFARIVSSKSSGKGDILTGGVNGLDKAIIILTAFTALNGILLWRVYGELIFQLGYVYTSFGAYFLLRHLIRDDDDVTQLLRVWSYVAVVVAAIMLGEQLTGKNALYVAIGGARAAWSESVGVRDGSLRATGSFAHPILAGTFGGFSLPLFVGLWVKDKKERTCAVAGAVASVVMAISTNSSTALMGGIGGLVALSFWRLRRKMRIVRWVIVTVLVGLHLYMKSPVWHIISDIDITGSSSSYHRYMLVDQCIRHLWDWVLVGTKSYGDWGWDMGDLSNQYVGTADTAGLIPLIALLTIIVYGFKYLGTSRQNYGDQGDGKQEFFIWAIGASLFANVIAFFGIGYFDQTIVGWYALLAIISAVTLPARCVESRSSTVTITISDAVLDTSLTSTQSTLRHTETSADGILST